MESEARQASHVTPLTEMVFRQSPFVLFLSLTVSVLAFALLKTETSSPWLNYWLIAQFGLNGLRMLAQYAFRKNPRLMIKRIVVGLYGFSIFLAGLLWGSLVLFMNLDLSSFGQAYIYIILTGVSAGGLSAYAARADFYMAFIIPILSPLAIWSFTQQLPGYIWLGGLVATFIILLMYLGITLRGYLVRSSRLLDENSALLLKMSDANASLEKQIRSRKLSEAELERERNLFQQGPVVIYRCHADGNRPIAWISNNVHQFGYLPKDLIGTEFASLIHPEDLAVFEETEFGENEGVRGARLEYRLKKSDGDYSWVSDYSLPVYDESGKLTHRDGYLLDISQLYAANAALDEEKERAQVTLHSIGDAVITTNTHGRIDFMNPVAEQLTGWAFDQAKFSPLKDIFRLHSDVIGEWLEDPLENFFSISGDNDSRQLQGELHADDGRITTITYNVSPIRDLLDRLIGYVIVFHDVTEKRALQEELEYQARHDALTGLYNRREFEGRLHRLLKQSRREHEHHVLVYIDLDHFKLVNDTCGHSAGDELLKQLTQLFKETLRSSDVLARLGGDEFGILLAGCDVKKGREIAEKIRVVAEEYRFVWGDKSFDVGASIGLVAITQESDSIQALLSAADVACYIAKDLGRNRIHVYLESDTELHRRRIEMNWAGRISNAIKEDRLYLSYQDIVPVRNGETMASRHIEILLRMQDENGDTIMPGAFLSAAERYNLMPDLDRWVVRNAFEWYESQGYSSELLMAINLSGLSISSGGFLKYIRDLFSRLHVPPEAICFEITETAAIANLSAATRFMGELQRLGCRFALDDFGSGLSSFAYLKTLPVDYLKIDGHFVRDMLNDKVDRAMISAINDVGHTMSLQTIAEYVESQEILEELGRLDVDFAQGYAISKPQRLDGLLREDTYKMIVRQQGLIS